MTAAARLALACLLLSACASAPERVFPLSAPSAERFEFSGRIGVKYDTQNFSGSMRWRHLADSDEIWLYSPLGQTVANLRRDAAGAQLLTAEKKQYAAADAEQLTHEVLGWNLPLAGMQYWVLGLVAPQLPPSAVERDAAQRLSQLQQNAWRIEFARYAAAEQGGLPEKLTLQYHDIEIRLVIDFWADPAAIPAGAQP